MPDVLLPELLAYVNGSSSDETFAEACLGTARGLVDQKVGTAVVPEEVLNRAYIETAAELFHRQSAPNGITQFATPDGGQAVRVARDPLVAAIPLLAPFLPLGFG